MVALYKTAPKDLGSKAKFTKVRATISKPMKPLVKSFYEPYWVDKKLIADNLKKGHIVEGRLFFDDSMVFKNYGFVLPDPIEIEEDEP